MKVKLSGRANNMGKFLFFLIFIIFIAAFIITAVFVLGRFKSVFAEKASHAAKVRGINMLNSAVSDAIDGMNSQEFVNIKTDDNGMITSVTGNTAAMNKLRGAIVSAADDMAEEGDAIVYIPIGSLTDYPVLQGVGYRIPVRVVLDSVTKVDFNDEFESCGINQVKHSIFMEATAEISAISAAMTSSENVTVKIPVSETVIVGTVPNYYGNGLYVSGR